MENELTPKPAAPRAEVTIVSAFGRGDWLATELAHRGWKATLVDASNSLSPCEPEDYEGPFGWFEAADLLPSQAPLHMDPEEMLSCERGLVLWLKNGPLEFSSAVTDFQLRKFQGGGVAEIVESYLRHQGLPSPQAVRDLKSVAQLDFKDAWLAHLAHQFASPVAVESHRALSNGWALPVFAPLWIRRASKKGAIASLSHAQTSGAVVHTGLKIKQVNFDRREVVSLDLDGESRSVATRILVWTLSSAETEQISSEIAKTLFPKGAASPSGFWARFQVDLKSSGSGSPLDSVPAFSIVLDDPFLPWNGANLFILRQRKEAQSYDAWARLPIRAHGDTNYLKTVGEQIEKTLIERMPSFSPSVSAAASTLHTPVFAAGELDDLATVKSPNLFFCGPEQWQTLDALGRSRHQCGILERLDKIKAQWTIAELRASARLAPAKPPSESGKSL